MVAIVHRQLAWRRMTIGLVFWVVCRPSTPLFPELWTSVALKILRTLLHIIAIINRRHCEDRLGMVLPSQTLWLIPYSTRQFLQGQDHLSLRSYPGVFSLLRQASEILTV